MSSYNQQTKNPKTGEWENADWIDNYYGSHRYGVIFPSDRNGDFTANVYNPDEIELETKE